MTFSDRLDVRVCDSSLRDGSHAKSHQFSEQDVRAVVGALDAAGVPVIEVSHGDGYTTRYGHNKTVLVKKGDLVKKGQTIAKVGSTGRSTGPHVHYEVTRNGKRVNPWRYLKES